LSVTAPVTGLTRPETGPDAEATGELPAEAAL